MQIQPTGSVSDTPLVEVMAGFDAAGFEGQFSAGPGGCVRCVKCQHVQAAALFVIDATARLEGESDPADEVIVIGLRCPGCGVAGTLVLGYGPDSSGDDSDLIAALPRS